MLNYFAFLITAIDVNNKRYMANIFSSHAFKMSEA